jgi:hypothetical protein
MAERIVSPGVFTNEIDQSFLAGGIAQIGAAIVGPTVKGPALIPTQITSYSDFIKIFGDHTPNSYVPHVVEDYLKYGNVITVTRLLYEDGYYLTNGALAITAESASTKIVTHVLHPTRPVTSEGATSLFATSTLASGTSGKFALTVSGTYVAPADATAIGFNGSFTQTANISASIASTDNNTVATVFGKSALNNNYPVYVQYDNPTATANFADIAQVTTSLNIISNYEFSQDYQTASTPWITSQKIGSSPTNLFKFHTLSHGTSVNHEVKIGISDIKTSAETSDPDGYGSFTVTVRRVKALKFADSPYSSADTDSTPDPAESSYTNCNLNPNSPNYIVRKIGNKYQTINDSNELIISGEYANISKFIRVEVDPGVSNATNAASLIPFGFRAMNSPIPMVSGSINLAPITYQTTQVSGTYNSSVYFGFNFDVVNNLNYIAPIPTSGSTTGSNSDFYLGNILQDAGAGFPAATPYSGSLEGALTSSTFSSKIKNETRKFIVPFQGGFDGAKPNLKKYSGAKKDNILNKLFQIDYHD